MTHISGLLRFFHILVIFSFLLFRKTTLSNISDHPIPAIVILFMHLFSIALLWVLPDIEDTPVLAQRKVFVSKYVSIKKTKTVSGIFEKYHSKIL